MSEIRLDHWEKFIKFLSDDLPDLGSDSLYIKEISSMLDIPSNKILILLQIFSSASKISQTIFKGVDINLSSKKVKFRKRQDKGIIELKDKDYRIISDLIYAFKNINKGIPFQFNPNTKNPALKKINKLYGQYPFFFERLNGIIYPTKVCYELGNEALSYKKSNRSPEEITIKFNNEIFIFKIIK